jgi:hypothetical protein
MGMTCLTEREASGPNTSQIARVAGLEASAETRSYEQGELSSEASDSINLLKYI